MKKHEDTPDRAALYRAAKLLGGQSAMASVLGYADRRNVWPWFNTARRFPAEHCPAIERATNGAVSCEELCPDTTWVRMPDTQWPWHPQGRPLIDVAAAAREQVQERGAEGQKSPPAGTPLGEEAAAEPADSAGPLLDQRQHRAA